MASPTGQTGHARYTKQLVLLISTPVEDVIEAAAKEQQLSKAAVARAFLYAGIKAAGYDVATTDEPFNLPAVRADDPTL